jgi:hypothetical protein
MDRASKDSSQASDRTDPMTGATPVSIAGTSYAGRRIYRR